MKRAHGDCRQRFGDVSRIVTLSLKCIPAADSMTALALLNANMGFNQSLRSIGAGVFTYITAAVHSHGQTGRIECWPTGMAFLMKLKPPSD